MKLFVALSVAEAEQAQRGALREDVVWTDTPRPEAVAPDAVWVSIEVEDKRMPRFEKRLDPRLGYREFLLPARVTNLHQIQRVELPL